MIKIHPLIFILTSLCLVLLYLYLHKERDPQPAGNYTRPIQIASVSLYVEIADTPEKTEKGLSGRRDLKDGNGMLFIFPYAQNVTFWMPDMNFPIDMIFLKDKKVVYIEPNVPNPPKDTPRNQLPLYSPKQPVDMVLEVPAGWSNRNAIKIGDSLNLK